jgi:hypothetical protein
MAKGYRGINRYVFRYPNVTPSRNNPQGPDKTGGVAHRKQLLWVGAIPFTTHFNGTIKVQINLPVV